MKPSLPAGVLSRLLTINISDGPGFGWLFGYFKTLHQL
jgi:hypothetical protein